MTESDNVSLKIKPLTENSDYALWKVRLESACVHKNCEEALVECPREMAEEDYKKKQKLASSIMVMALSDPALRIVHSVKHDPVKMIELLDARYASKTAASKITKMSDLITMKFTSLRSDLPMHIDQMRATIEQLKAMSVTIEDSFAVTILVASIEVAALRPATTAIKTLAEDDLKWDTVAERLTEEAKGLKEVRSTEVSLAAVPRDGCQICGKENHPTSKCFLNPMYAHNRLGLDADKQREIEERSVQTARTDRKGKGKKKTKKSGERSAVARPSKKGPDMMLVDSGTSAHMTSRSDRVISKEHCDVDISLGDNSKVHSSHKGIRKVMWHTQEGERTISLSDTLVSKKLAMSMLSVPALVKKNIASLFLPGKALFIDLEDDMKVIGTAAQADDGLFYIADRQEAVPEVPASDTYAIRGMMAIAKEHVQSCDDYETEMDVESGSKDEVTETDEQDQHGQDVCKEDPAKLWHLRLGHAVAVRAVRSHIKKGLLPQPKCPDNTCEYCTRGKYRRKFDGTLTGITKVGRLHVDTKGKVEAESTDGHKYFLTVVEEYSRYTYVCPIRTKGETSDELLRFVKCFEKQSSHVIREVHADGGGEFKRAKRALEDKGVKFTLSTPYSPQSNGLAERAHGVILSSARSCLLQAKLPVSFWSHAIKHVTACKNMLIHSTTGRVPYKDVFDRLSSDLHHVRPFGCRALYQPVAPRLKTFKPRLEQGINLGHTDGGIYKILTTTGIVRTKHVRMFETVFPGTLQTEPDTQDVEDGSESEINIQESSSESDSQTESDNESGGEQPPDRDELLTYTPAKPSSFGETDEDTGNGTDQDEEEPSSGSDNDFDDTVAQSDLDDEEDNNHDDGSASSRGYNLRPRRVVNYSFRAVPVNILDDTPLLKQALKSDDKVKWRTAINEEFETLFGANTFTIVKGPKPGEKVLPTGIVLKLKRDQHGKPARHKARVVVRGNWQQKGSSYVELYVPVACIELVRALLAIAAILGWEVDHVDIKGAFLYAELPEKDRILVRLPNVDGVKLASGQYARLNKSLYGLRQAPKLWYAHLSRVLRSIGMEEAQSTNCLFKTKGSESVFVLVYVDDLLVVGSKTAVTKVKAQLARHFTTTDLGPCCHFLGIAVDRSDNGIFLSQRPFTERIVELAGLTNAKPTPTPLLLSHPLYEKEDPLTDVDEAEMRHVPYRPVLGSLLYLATRTRPDIATAVSMLAKFQEAPAVRHWKAMKHVVRYLKGTPKMGILLPKQGDVPKLQVWSDADWARDQSKRRSRTGAVITINYGPIGWTSKLQTSVATSTAEAEFNALAVTVRDTVWMRSVLDDLGQPQKGPTVVNQDNLGTISWTEEVQGLRNVKHMGIKYHYVRELVSKKRIIVNYTPSKDNRADSLTKVLIGDSFLVHRSLLGVVDKTFDAEEAC